MPVMNYPSKIDQASAGWGSTAILKDGELWMIGRPHDFVNLLRLYRSPAIIRQWSNSGPDSAETTFVGSKIPSAIGWATGLEDKGAEWERAHQQLRLLDWTKIEVPKETAVTSISSSAGFTALIGASGTCIHLGGINSRGQCGLGKVSNNVWVPEAVVGLNSSKGSDPSLLVDQEERICQVALGLQHGFALSSTSGQVYSWGKAGHGQLRREANLDQDSIAKPVVAGVSQVSSGMHHGAALTYENQVFIWGETMNNIDGEGDARLPQLVRGLPQKQVIQISCGSHHTALFLEDGSVYAILGVAADMHVPIMDPVQLIPPGVVDLPLRQFELHQDRTTIIGRNGQVFQVNLWRDESLREYAMFTPPWVDYIY